MNDRDLFNALDRCYEHVSRKLKNQIDDEKLLAQELEYAQRDCRAVVEYILCARHCTRIRNCADYDECLRNCSTGNYIVGLGYYEEIDPQLYKQLLRAMPFNPDCD